LTVLIRTYYRNETHFQAGVLNCFIYKNGEPL